MHKYWNLPLSSYAPRPLTWNRIGELWNPVVPEVYLSNHFYRQIEYAYENTLASWWQALADLFLVIDRHSISHFWPKNNFACDFREGGNEAHLRLMALCTFRDWLNLTRGLMPGSFDEERIKKSPPNEAAANVAA
jgi:hypothetical protein